MQQEKERAKLNKTEPLAIIEYIKTSIEILMNLKSQQLMEKAGSQSGVDPFREKIMDSLEESPTVKESSHGDSTMKAMDEYEKMIQKLEGDVWTHIRIEQ